MLSTAERRAGEDPVLLPGEDPVSRDMRMPDITPVDTVGISPGADREAVKPFSELVARFSASLEEKAF